jgi:hypothetical protein
MYCKRIFRLLFIVAHLSVAAQHSFPPIQSIEFQQSTLPILNIDTRGALLSNKSENKRIAATFRIIDKGTGNVNSVQDTNYAYEGYIGIKYRGNSSFSTSPKKPYSIELWDHFSPADSLAKDLKRSLLGMNPAADWVLLAPYNDKSFMRDVLLFDLMRGTQEFVPHARYCELIFNGVYHGLYILTEKVERGSHRLNIPSSKTSIPSESGYHIEIDRDNEPGFRSSADIRNLLGRAESWRTKPWYQFKYPKERNLTPEQRAYIINRIDAFEKVIESDLFNHPEEGYARYIHPGSVASFIIAQELSRNVDGYRLSTPLYKHADSVDPRFRMSLWDFNIAFGNADYGWAWSTEGWSYNQTAFAAPYWFKKMLQDRSFYELLTEQWKELRNTSLKAERIMEKIDSISYHIQDAVVRNQQAWDIAGRKVWPNYFFSKNHAEELDYLKRWIERRIAWMDGQWLDNPSNHIANGHFDADTELGHNSPTSITVSQWPRLGGQPLVNYPVYSGKYSFEFTSRNIASQVVTELPPGLYTLRVKIKTQGTPDAYIFVKNHGRSEQKINIPNIDGEFRTVELRDIEVSLPHAEVGIAAWYSSGSGTARAWYDEVEFFQQRDITHNQNITNNTITVTYDPTIETLKIFTNFSHQNSSCIVYDIAGRIVVNKQQLQNNELTLALEPGIYVLALLHDNQWIQRKFSVASR